MPRPPRVFVDGAYYHVYCRVGRGEPVFQDDAEAEALVKVLGDVKRRDGYAVLAWCVMSNHYHLAVRCGDVPLWRSMRLVQGRYSKGFNRRRNVYGALWQGRYKAKLVVGERNLQQLIVYVHLNPVAAGAVRDPSGYRWSGHKAILAPDGDGLADAHETLLVFGGDQETARRSYVRALEAGARSSWLEREPGRLPWWRAGDGTEMPPPPQGTPRIDALGASTAPERRALRPDEYLFAAANALGVALPALSGSRSGRELTRLRGMLALVAVETYGVRVKDLAQLLGRNPGVVSRWASMAGERRSHDETFRDRAEQLVAEVRALTTPTWAEESDFVSGAPGSFVD
jgi:REP element-mobilizing transposase RayT